MLSSSWLCKLLFTGHESHHPKVLVDQFDGGGENRNYPNLVMMVSDLPISVPTVI